LSDITEATGLTKGSIYGNFENKDEVATAVYEYNVSILDKKMNAYCSGKHTAYEKLTGLTLFYRENWESVFKTGGCPLLNTAVEADDSLFFLKGKVQKSFKAWQQKVVTIIEAGKKSGEFRQGVSSTEYAAIFIVLIEGGIVLSKIMNNKKHLFLALDRVIQVIDEELVN